MRLSWFLMQSMDLYSPANLLDGTCNCDVVECLCRGFEQQDVEDEKANTSLTESLSQQSAHQTCSRSISLPTPLKLVLAMKGLPSLCYSCQVVFKIVRDYQNPSEIQDPVPRFSATDDY